MRMFGLMLIASGVVLFSQQAMEAAQTAAQTFVSGVMPALFPMMVLSRLMPSGGGGWLSCAAFGFLAGSPASACRARDIADTQSAPRLMALTGVMSPMFFVGTLAKWTGAPASCQKLLWLHWASAAIVWALLPGKLPGKTGGQAATLPRAIAESMTALLSVAGAMMLFAILSALLGALGLRWKLLWPLLEIGGGMAQAAGHVSWPVMGALCSFGGLSIWMQNLLFVGQIISPVKLLGIRLLHGAVCYALCMLTF